MPSCHISRITLFAAVQASYLGSGSSGQCFFDSFGHVGIMLGCPGIFFCSLLDLSLFGSLFFSPRTLFSIPMAEPASFAILIVHLTWKTTTFPTIGHIMKNASAKIFSTIPTDHSAFKSQCSKFGQMCFKENDLVFVLGRFGDSVVGKISSFAFALANVVRRAICSQVGVDIVNIVQADAPFKR